MGENTNLLRLIQTLAPAVAYKESNVEMNRKEWKPDQDWVKKMAGNLGDEWEEQELRILGDEWSDRASLMEIIDGWVLPNIPDGACVAEIGVGGGRVASRVAPRCGTLHCFDISQEMIKRSRDVIGAVLPAGSGTVVEYHVQDGNSLHDGLTESLDFVYSFDCLPHCDVHTIFAYLKEFKRVLRPGGKGLVHTSNITSQAGFGRFEKQKEASVQGFCWVSPDMVRTLVAHAGLQLLRESTSIVDSNNIYINRDYMCLVGKPGAASS